MGDIQANGLIALAKAHGIRVPQDISVMGCNDDPIALATNPPVTTMRFPLEDMGKSAVQALSDFFDTGSFPENKMMFIPEIIVRDSTGPL